MLDMQPLIARMYWHAATTPLDQFRAVALTSLADCLNASSAFWSYCIRTGTGFETSAVVRVGNTPGLTNAHEYCGAENPWWPASDPTMPGLLRANGRINNIPTAAAGTLSFCAPLSSCTGFQLINIVVPEHQRPFMCEVAEQFEIVAMHACSASDLSMRLLTNPDVSGNTPIKVKAVFDQQANMVQAGPGFEQHAANIMLNGIARDLFEQMNSSGSTRIEAKGEIATIECFGGLRLLTVEFNNQTGKLTQRQRHIAKLICSGRTDREIAEQLDLAHSTVSNHANEILRRMKIKSRRELRYLL